MVFGHSRLAIRHAPIDTGAFLTAPGGLYDGPEDAKVAARHAARQAARPGINAEHVMTDDVESRRRRAAYRATHRGTKEMDWLIGRFAQARLAAMPAEALTAFERLLLLPDPDLHDMIMHPEVAPAGEHAAAGRRAARLPWIGVMAEPQTAKPAAAAAPARPRDARPACRTAWCRWCWRGSPRRPPRPPRAPPLLLHVARDDRRLEAIAEGARLLRPQGAGHPVPRLGHGALRPHRPQQRDRRPPHRRAGPPRRRQPQGPDAGPHHGQRHPAARAAARVHPPLAQDHRAGPAPRHGPADPAPQPGRLHAQRHRHGARRVRGARRHPRPVPAGPHHARAPRLLRRHAGAHQGVRPRDAAHRQDRAARDPDADQRGGLRRGGREAVPPPLRGDVRRRRRPTTRSTRRSAPASAIPAWSTGCRCSTSSWRRCSTTCRTRPVSFDHLADEAVDAAPRPDPRPLRGARRGPGDADLRRAALQAGAARGDVPRRGRMERGCSPAARCAI